MRPRSAAVIALRIFATVLTVEVLTAVVGLLAGTRDLEGTGPFWAIVGAKLVIAFLLWIAADALASAFVQSLPDEGAAAPRHAANIHAIALSVVGVILAAQGVTTLISVAVTETDLGPIARLTATRTFGGFPFVGRGAALLIALVTLVIGLVLIFAAGAIAKGLSDRYPEPEPPLPPPA